MKFEWILNRIQRLWPEWAKALAALQARQPFSHGSANVSNSSVVCDCGLNGDFVTIIYIHM